MLKKALSFKPKYYVEIHVNCFVIWLGRGRYNYIFKINEFFLEKTPHS